METKKAVTKKAATKKPATKKPATKKAATKKAKTPARKKAQLAPATLIADEQAIAGAAPTILGTGVTRTPEHSVFSTRAPGQAVAAQAEMIRQAAGRSKNPRPTRMMPASILKQEVLPFPNLTRQWLADTKGYARTGISILAGDSHSGKSTLVFSDMAHLMRTRETRVLYIECEGQDKMPSRDRIMRCMHTDPKIAAHLLNSVMIDSARSVVQLQDKMTRWAKMMREGIKEDGVETFPPMPKHVSLFIAVDPMGRLMSAAEAEGNLEWDDLASKKSKEVHQGTNLGQASFASRFSRWLPGFTETYGVHVLFVYNATERISMNSQAAKKTMMLAEWKEALLKMTFIGGKALRALAGLTTFVTFSDYIQDPRTKVIQGKMVRAMTHKTSHGADYRFSQWLLRTNHEGYDRPDYIQPILDYSFGLVDILQKGKIFGFRQDDKSRLCALELDQKFTGLTPQQVDSLLHSRPAALEEAGKALRIPGYVSLMDLVQPDDAPQAPTDSDSPGEDTTQEDGTDSGAEVEVDAEVEQELEQEPESEPEESDAQTAAE